MKHVVWGAIAQRDLRGIIDHYGIIDPDLPLSLIDRLEGAAISLLDFPGLGPELSDSSFRQWHAKGTPFILFYRTTSNGIRILKVRHARSNWKPR